MQRSILNDEGQISFLPEEESINKQRVSFTSDRGKEENNAEQIENCTTGAAPAIVFKRRFSSFFIAYSSKLSSTGSIFDVMDDTSDANNFSNDYIHKFRHRCGIIVKSRRTQKLIILLILVYATLMGVATYPVIRNDPRKAVAIDKVQIAILIVFTVEIIMQMIYHGPRRFCNKSRYVFDSVIIILTWVCTLLPLWSSLRIFQTLRLIGRLNSMREVIRALLYAADMLIAISCLLLIIFFIFSVLFTSLYKNMYKHGQTEIDYFSNLSKSAFTLFQVMCLDDWSDIVREVMRTHTWAWMHFMSFIILAAFIVLDSIIGVFCMGLHEIQGVSFVASSHDLQEDIDYEELLEELIHVHAVINAITVSQQLSLVALQPFLDTLDIKRNDKGNTKGNRVIAKGISLRVIQEKGKDITQSSLKHLRNACNIINNNKTYQAFIISLIIMNALMLGLNTYKAMRSNPIFSTIFSYTDTIFLVCFTIEIAIKLLSYGLVIFKDAWFIIDFLVTLLSWGLNQIQIFRSIKIIRLMTLISRVKPLKDVVKALQSCMPKLFNLFALLLCIFYIFSVLFTSLYKNMYKNGQTEIDYFSSLPKTAFTLFQVMCLDNWSDIAREVMRTHTWAWMHFMTFVTLTALLIIKMFISLLCDAVCVIRQQEYYDILEENNMSTDNVYEQVNDLLTFIYNIEGTQKNIEDYVQSLTTFASKNGFKRTFNVNISKINKPSIGFVSKPKYEILHDTNRGRRRSTISSGKSYEVDDTFNFNESFRFVNEGINEIMQTEQESIVFDDIGVIVEAKYEILNHDMLLIADNNSNGFITTDTILMTENTGSIRKDEELETLLLDNIIKSKDEKVIDENDLTISHNDTNEIAFIDEEILDENILWPDDGSIKNQDEKMVSNGNTINQLIHRSMINHFCMHLQCSSTLNDRYDDDDDTFFSCEQYG